jgi:hypothetical protein
MFIITLRSSGLLPAAFLAVAMTTCLAHFVMKITQVRKSCDMLIAPEDFRLATPRLRPLSLT